MTAQELLDAYTAYLAQNKLLRLPVADTSIARLYGTEEVHFGAAGEISFEGLPGVVATEGLAIPETFDWVALVVAADTGEADIIFGAGSPYSQPVLAGLPAKNGLVLALPNALLSGRAGTLS
jgi:hypothetical protein